MGCGWDKLSCWLWQLLATALTTIFSIYSFSLFYKIEEFVGAKKRIYNLNITLTDRPGQIGLVCSALGNLEIEIKNVDLKRTKY